MQVNDIKESNVVYDIDTEQISGIASRCSSIGSSISSATIKVPALVSKYASGVVSAANNTSAIASALSVLKGILIGAIASSGASDVSYDDDDTKSNYRNNYETSTNVQGMTGINAKNGQEIFEAMGYKVEDGKVSIGDYTYDIKTKKLTKDGTSSSIVVEYYLPNSLLSTDSEGKITVDKNKLSQTNTITMLGDNNSEKMSSRRNFGEYSPNSILVVPAKKKNGKSYTNAINNQKAEIIDSTEFSKSFSNQKDGCKNYIMGVSNGGGSALKIGASNTYDGVVVINYKPMINGSKTNESSSTVEERLDAEDLKSYEESGKPILFISAAKDGSGSVDNIKLMESGMDYIKENYPNVNAKWITNNEDILNKHYSYVLDQTTDIENKNTYWGSFIPTNCKGDGVDNKGQYAGKYARHGAFDGIALNLLNHGYLDGNEYNDDNIIAW